MMVFNNGKRWVIGTLALALILAACAPTAAGVNVNGSEAGTAPAVGETNTDRAPNFTISFYQGEQQIDGDQAELYDLLTQGKPVVLNFWAGLCPPCRIEMPDLDSVQKNRIDEIILIGVDVGPFTNLGSREQGRELVEELGVNYPIGTTFEETIMQQYQVLGMPSTYFIKPDGTIHETWSGLLTESKLEELVEELIAASEVG